MIMITLFNFTAHLSVVEVIKTSPFKETLQVTSSNDACGNFHAHDINSLYELCQIFTKINLTTEKRLKYVAMFSIFASNPN